ncbi:hypothetical protein DFJ73DRAFT_958196 [Zopfochytrium polystomum]|nr:hypothetical protein DFJ73DRAFT_958196 [Zopfochytrium polystomum]
MRHGHQVAAASVAASPGTLTLTMRAGEHYPRVVPTDPWAKQQVGMAKQSLGTDIVMGDAAFFSKSRQFATSMASHYVDHGCGREPQRPLGGTGEEEGRSGGELVLDDTGLPADRRLREGKVVDPVDMEPAGKPLGISGSSFSRDNHIVFGDVDKKQTERLTSVTGETFRGHETEVVVVNTATTAKPADPTPRDEYRRQWEPPRNLIMASAHAGLATRNDLPLDERHFNNFTTTSQDAYQTLPSQRDNDGFATAAASVASKRGGYSIQLGDRDKQRSYESVAATSFVRHARDYYARTGAAGAAAAGKTGGNGRAPIRVEALLGRSGEPMTFRSTTRGAYGGGGVVAGEEGDDDDGATTPAGLATYANANHRGKSSIAFGEHSDGERLGGGGGGGGGSGARGASSLTSVTQRDFGAGVAGRGAAFARIRDSERVGGVRQAVHADAREARWAEGGGSADEGGGGGGPVPVQRHDPHGAAGTSARAAAATATLSKASAHASSIPQGDPTKFSFARGGGGGAGETATTTTTRASYPSHVGLVPFPTFPVLGAKITQSGFSLAAENWVLPSTAPEAQTGMLSTAAAAFVDHGNDGRRAARRESFRAKMTEEKHGIIGQEQYQMRGNRTTNSVVYKKPRDEERLFVLAAAPPTAARRLLFPIKAQKNSYDTTTNASFGKRLGIYTVTGPIDTKSISMRTSSLVFGDRRHYS